MAIPPIKFGTDGWRAIIGAQYTFANLARVTQATAQWIIKTYGTGATVVLGHDTRFLGREFAEHAASVLAANGIAVRFASTFTTTPSISWATKAYGCAAGIVITASHNPPAYNGFKIKAHVGGPASPAMIKAVEAELATVGEVSVDLTFAEACRAGTVVEEDIAAAYVAMLREQIDVAAIQGAGLTIAHDAMYGAGQGVLQQVLGHEHVRALHHDINPGFYGQAPEPIERNLAALAEVVIQERCAAAIANDGDADRIGMYDEQGHYVSSHLLLALLVRYLHKTRGLTGDIVKTFSTTHMLDKMGAAYGLTVRTTPIGFKYIGPMIVEGDVLVGGEESGGMAVKGHIPERDGIYIGLLVLEMMVKRGAALSALVRELFDEFGPHYTYRQDLKTTPAKKETVLRQLAAGTLTEVNGQHVRAVDTLDGYKHLLDTGWVMVRPSGTEPVLRIYSEGESQEQAQFFVEEAIKFLEI